MRAILDKSKTSGNITPPASKSYSIRSIIAAGLAGGKSIISNLLHADDTMAAITILKNLNVSVEEEHGDLIITGGNLNPTNRDLDCQNSAATLRFMTAVCATLPAVSRLLAGPSLARRPIKPLLNILETMGAETTVKGNMVIVKGSQLKGGIYNIYNDQSSQFISALLLIAPVLKERVVYHLASVPRSKPYIDMTIETMRQFGIDVKAQNNLTCFAVTPQQYRPTSINIEGDWSSASYLLALGVLCGELTVTGLNLLSLQGDKAIVALLQEMGASMILNTNSITVRPSRLNGITADISQCIDLLPTIGICAAVAEGTTRLNGIATARLKESNRVDALCQGLGRMGIEVKQSEDSLEIRGGLPCGSDINSFNDHRIAMAFAILGVKVGSTIIDNAECVAKTYPDFWLSLKNLNGKVRLVNE